MKFLFLGRYILFSLASLIAWGFEPGAFAAGGDPHWRCLLGVFNAELNNQEVKNLLDRLQDPVSAQSALEEIVREGVRIKRELQATSQKEFGSENPSLSSPEIAPELRPLAVELVATQRALKYLFQSIEYTRRSERAWDFLRTWTRAQTSPIFSKFVQKSTSTEVKLQIMRKLAAKSDSQRDRADRLEGTVAAGIERKLGQIEGFNTRVMDPQSGKIYEADIRLSRALIEVTNRTGSKTEQIFERYFSDYMNPKKLPVILFAPNYLPGDGTHDLLESVKKSLPFLIVHTESELHDALAIIYPEVSKLRSR